MDPRNFFNNERIFQFEALNYQADTQIQAGVEKILTGSFMGNKSFSYRDDSTNDLLNMLYAEAFIRAADISNVSPYHLASRALIELGSNGSTSVSGTFSQDLVDAYAARGVTYTPTSYDTRLDGIYNFYNIGASSSTALLGNVRNGLEYARLSTILFDQVEFNPSYQSGQEPVAVPWNNRYKSIAAGAIWIGSKYINVGQCTLYLQKFDVDDSDGRLYWHQYMTNVQAAWSEGKKIYSAYSSMGILDDAMTFIIPVYRNMPQTACQLPNTGNPNNWLKSLSITGYSLTPTFDPDTTGEYSLIVDSDVTSIRISAAPVTSEASITGSGTIQLAIGENRIKVIVTAENGNKRTYTLTVIRKVPDGYVTPTPTPTPGPTHTPGPTTTPGPTATPTPTPKPLALSSPVYTVTEGSLCGLDPRNGSNAVETVLANLACESGLSIEIVDADGDPCTGLVGTNCVVLVKHGDSLVAQFKVVLFGDANGDGKINAIDLTTINWHLLKKSILPNDILIASDVNNDDKVNAIDLATIVRHLLNKLDINQS